MRQPTPEMEQRFSDWQRALTLTDKRNQSADEVTQRQLELIAAVNGGSQSLVSYLRDVLDIDSTSQLNAPPLPRRIDPSELRDPPLQLEVEISAAWSELVSAREASQPLFWTRCHLDWIGQGQFGEQLDDAFLGTLASGAKEKTSEAATRNLLRRLGGLPHVRGKVSVLNDCPLARAWWRGYVADNAARHCEGMLDPLTAHRVLHSSNDAWARLVGDSVRRITVVNHSGLRAAFIAQYPEARRDGEPVPAQELQTAVRLLARQGPTIIFGSLDCQGLSALASEAVNQVRADEDLESQDEPPSAPSTGSPDPPGRRLTRLLRRLT